MIDILDAITYAMVFVAVWKVADILQHIAIKRFKSQK